MTGSRRRAAAAAAGDSSGSTDNNQRKYSSSCNILQGGAGALTDSLCDKWKRGDSPRVIQSPQPGAGSWGRNQRENPKKWHLYCGGAGREDRKKEVRTRSVFLNYNQEKRRSALRTVSSLDACCSSADFSCLFGHVVAFLWISEEGIGSLLVDERSESRRGSVSCVCQRAAAGLKKPPQGWPSAGPPSPPASKTTKPVRCESREKKERKEERKQHVRPDANLPARGENRQNEKVEENFVWEFQEYRWALSFFCFPAFICVCRAWAEKCVKLQQQQRLRLLLPPEVMSAPSF